MIAGISGRLESLGSNWAIIDVGGVSFQVFVPTSTLSTLGRIGKEVKLHTHLHVRDDILALYGFGSAEELALFQTLLGVSGIGPKLAMAMLSAMEVAQLTMAIASGNADILTGIPGIGKKTANRIILELKDKISTGWVQATELEAMQENSEVLAALTSLGYSVSEATRAIISLPASKSLTIEEKVKLALQSFGRK